MKLVLFIAIAVLPFGLFAQSYEAGLMFGASAYQGDISPETVNLSTGKAHPSLGLFFRYNVNKYLTAKANFSYGRVSGNDAAAGDEGRKARNLSFQTNIYEFGITGELNLFGFEPGGLQNRYSPYLFGGIAVFHFNPETNYDGELVELQPLGTEGQGMEGFDQPYKLTQIAIPMGVGMKFAVSERLNIGAEIGFRKTFTDYLDDVSGTYVAYSELLRENGELAAALGDRRGELITDGNDIPVVIETGTQTRGNPGEKDWYAMAGLTISYTFYPKNGFGKNSGKKNDFGCPKF
ncbi:MAG: hypothetical protein ACI8X3_003304 [Saprospiraceae bacterium]|jgi:hypothetical protein